MQTVTLSSKYQVVIPKALRKGLSIKPGQKIKITKTKEDIIELSTHSSLDKYVGSVRGVWGDDPVAYIRKQRDEWDD